MRINVYKCVQMCMCINVYRNKDLEPSVFIGTLGLPTKDRVLEPSVFIGRLSLPIKNKVLEP